MSSELLQSPCPLALERHAGENNYKNVQAKKYRGRLVIATLKKEDDAITLHKNGRGYALWGTTAAENVWVNADLPKCDRDAKLLSRQ